MAGASDVICLGCGAEVAADTGPCPRCDGAPEERCEECRQGLWPGFRFCPGCGRPRTPESRVALASSFPSLREQMPAGLAEKVLATRGRIEGERKQVTVLFCDLVRSATIAEQMDPEDYRDLLDRYLAIVLDQVFRVEGFVNQIAGDGVMALFGAPIAHEDAPARAVHAALGIRDGVRALAASLAAERRAPLEVRVGVHAGPVIVGTVGNDLKMDYTAIGDTTNLAARLQGMARPGTVLLSEEARRLVAGPFRFRSIGSLAIRGRTVPVEAWEVDEGPPIEREEASSADVGPLIGRADELARLTGVLERAARGELQVVAIGGETGLGKSRLAREIAARAPAGSVVLWGQCLSYASQAPYRLLIGMLQRHLGLAGDEPETVLRATLSERLRGLALDLEGDEPALGRLFGHASGRAPELGGDELRGASLEAVVRWIAAEAGRSLVLIVVEDVQWIDEASGELLRVLIERAPRARLLLVATHRPGAARPWPHEVESETVALSPLSRADAQQLVAARIGGDPAAEVCEAILGRAEGNPLFIEEVTRELVDAGVVVETPGGPVLTREIGRLEVPITVHEIVAARLDRLAPEQKRVVQVCSVIGRRFDADLVAAVLEPDGIEVHPRLAELEKSGVLRSGAPPIGQLEFAHALAQEVAYDGLLHRQVRKLHARIAEVLELRHGTAPGAASAVIAFHFQRGGARARSVEHLLAAAAHAESVPSYTSAADLYAQAWELETAEPGADADPQRALSAGLRLLGMAALFGVGKEAMVERLAVELEPLLDRVGTPSDRVAAATFTGVLRLMGGAEQHASGLDRLGQAMALARAAGSPVWRWRVLRGLALGYVLDGRFDEALAAVEEALAEISQAGPEVAGIDVLLWARTSRDNVLLQRDEIERCIADSTETHRLAVENGNRSVQVGAAGLLATAYLLHGEPSEAPRWARRGLELAESVGSRSGVSNLAAVSVLATGAGDGAAADCRRIESDLATVAGAQQSLRFVVDAFLLAGERERAEKIAQLVRRRAGGRLRQAQSAVALARVELAGDRGDGRRAEYFLDEAERVAGTIGARSVLASALRTRAGLLERRGDANAAVAARQRASELAAAIGMRWDG
jgi:class 3 adenylate cyclase/tetratricopeptide (TPR) repeat protein